VVVPVGEVQAAVGQSMNVALILPEDPADSGSDGIEAAAGACMSWLRVERGFVSWAWGCTGRRTVCPYAMVTPIVEMAGRNRSLAVLGAARKRRDLVRVG